MSNHKRVAGVQTDIHIGNVPANLARMETWLKEPALQGVDLVVFPECMLSGYCYDSLDEAWPHAQTVPGPATDRMIEVCRQHQVHIAFGMLERGNLEPSNRQLHNSCVLVGPDGLVGTYRKTHLPYLGIDRFVTAGRDPFQVFTIEGMRVGMHICYDASFPETCRLLSLAGADLLILPTNWPPGATNFARYLPNARALENNVYFLAVNRVGTEGRFRFIGQSRLCDTNGDNMVEALHEQEAVFVGSIDLEKARTKRLVHVPNQHIIDRFADRRPDLYDPLSDRKNS